MKRYALNSCEMLIDALKDNYPNPHSERLKREILEPHNSTVNCKLAQIKYIYYVNYNSALLELKIVYLNFFR